MLGAADCSLNRIEQKPALHGLIDWSPQCAKPCLAVTPAKRHRTHLLVLARPTRATCFVSDEIDDAHHKEHEDLGFGSWDLGGGHVHRRRLVLHKFCTSLRKVTHGQAAPKKDKAFQGRSPSDV